jgi:hypothetical protein
MLQQDFQQTVHHVIQPIRAGNRPPSITPSFRLRWVIPDHYVPTVTKTRIMHLPQQIVIHAIRQIITVQVIPAIKHLVSQLPVLSVILQIRVGNQQPIHNMMPSHFQFIPVSTGDNGQIVLNVIQILRAMPHSVA